MEIRLDQIGARPFTWQETLELDPTELDASGGTDLTVSPVVCNGSIDPTSQGFILRARLRYRQEMSCVRCLEPWGEDVDTEIGLLLTLVDDADMPAEELSREDLGAVALEDSRFDTRPLLLEQVQLAVPMKPLCREDCAGLCSRCGSDLNQGPCDCQPDIDPRWAQLAALRGGETQ